MNFIREQGVIGLAVGFILGGAISGLIQAFVDGIINPLVGWVFQSGNLGSMTTTVGKATLSWGNVVVVFINFVIIAAVVYFGVRALGLDKIDRKKK